MGTAADAGGGDGEDVEVYANGVAFDVVKGWLGKEGNDLDWNSWYGAEDVDGDRPARQERLGLGAKFLPHSRAVQLMGGVQKKLGKAIAQSRRRADEDDDDDDDASAARRGGVASWRANSRGGLGSGGGGRPGASAAAARGGDDSDSDSDSDGGGRAAASFKGSAAKRKATAAWDPTKDPKLLRGAPGSSAKKKKKK